MTLIYLIKIYNRVKALHFLYINLHLFLMVHIHRASCYSRVTRNNGAIPFRCERLVSDFRDTLARDCKSRMRDYATYIFFFFSKIIVFLFVTAKRLAWTGEVSIHSYIKSPICSYLSLMYYSPGFKATLMQAANYSINS